MSNINEKIDEGNEIVNINQTETILKQCVVTNVTCAQC